MSMLSQAVEEEQTWSRCEAKKWKTRAYSRKRNRKKKLGRGLDDEKMKNVRESSIWPD